MVPSLDLNGISYDRRAVAEDYDTDLSETDVNQTQQQKQKRAKGTGMTELAKKFASRIRLDDELHGVAQSVANDVKTSNRKADAALQKTTDKSDRATVEQVLDPRTRMILFKMLNRNVISEINGTGKEANVYHATTEDKQHRAIKVYKTSILVFKDRDRYVTGEYRFRHGYNKSNPRKMVKVWAEKEMRNLKRVFTAGIPCPDPIQLRMHVLLMTFIGDENGIAAPRLKDAVIESEEEFRTIYMDLVKMVWKLYHVCHLIHADLSEYNLLYLFLSLTYQSRYFRNTLYMIDVSQSVEHEHPQALEFLRKDCTNVVDFFKRRLGDDAVFTVRELFEFIIKDRTFLELQLNTSDAQLADDSLDTLLDAYLVHVHTLIKSRPPPTAEQQISDAVFKQVYIPLSLTEIVDVESQMRKMGGWESKDSDAYKSVIGVENLVTPAVEAVNMFGLDCGGGEDSDCAEIGSESSDSSDSDSDSDVSRVFEEREVELKGKKYEDKDLKRERKKQMKDDKCEKRKIKMPKSVKKRKVKVAADKKKK